MAVVLVQPGAEPGTLDSCQKHASKVHPRFKSLHTLISKAYMCVCMIQRAVPCACRVCPGAVAILEPLGDTGRISCTRFTTGLHLLQLLAQTLCMPTVVFHMPRPAPPTGVLLDPDGRA
jgi:hypothetical protein